MSTWNEIRKQSSGTVIRKEDLPPTLKLSEEEERKIRQIMEERRKQLKRSEIKVTVFPIIGFLCVLIGLSILLICDNRYLIGFISIPCLYGGSFLLSMAFFELFNL